MAKKDKKLMKEKKLMNANMKNMNAKKDMNAKAKKDMNAKAKKDKDKNISTPKPDE